MASVDVVVPCYKYGRYLRDCVQSVLNQQGVDVRVLIIDDCSPDNTPEVAQQLCAEDSRVEYRRHTENKGHIATYNEGLLEWACADACVLISADDLLAPGALQRAMQCMRSHPKISFVYGDCHDFSDAAPPTFTSDIEQSFAFSVIAGEVFIRQMCETARNFVPTPTVVVRTAIQHQVGGYLPDLPHAGDMEMWLRLAAVGDVAKINFVQAGYRRHGSNMYMSYPYDSSRDILQRHQAIVRLLNCHSHRLSQGDEDELRSQAEHVLSTLAMGSAWSAFNHSDTQECRALMRIAIELSPATRRTWNYFKLQIKIHTSYATKELLACRAFFIAK